MKEIISQEARTEFKNLNIMHTILSLVTLIAIVPLIRYFKWIGWVLLGVFAVITLVYVVKVEQFKKKYDIHTFKEIIAFTEGKTLDEISKAREEAKRPYQKALIPLLIFVVTVLVEIFFMFY